MLGFQKVNNLIITYAIVEQLFLNNEKLKFYLVGILLFHFAGRVRPSQAATLSFFRAWIYLGAHNLDEMDIKIESGLRAYRGRDKENNAYINFQCHLLSVHRTNRKVSRWLLFTTMELTYESHHCTPTTRSLLLAPFIIRRSDRLPAFTGVTPRISPDK